MNRAYLTSDDGPTKQTPKLMDYLTGEGITPIFFFTGVHIEENREEGIDAIRRGAIVGNHSYTHPNFDELTLEEGILEIVKTEIALNQLYEDAGVERRYKLFRFPYGAQGGKNKEKFQEFLSYLGFDRIDDKEVASQEYCNGGHKDTTDVYWTFDFQEYRMHKRDGFGLQDILDNVHNKGNDESKGVLEENTQQIILLHDHMESEEILPGYYPFLLNYMMNHGITFIKPRFVKRCNL